MTIKDLREDRRPADLWFWNDWFSSFDVRSCSLAARGLWMDMLGVMRGAQIKGTLMVNGKQIDSKIMAKIAGVSEAEVAPIIQELEDANVFSRLEDGTIINRRMYRSSQISQARAEAGKKGASSRWQKDSMNGDECHGKAMTELEYEDENAITPKGSAEGKPKFEPRHLELAQFLEARVKDNVPFHKFTGTNYLEAWAVDFRLMEDRDKIPFDMMKAVLEWAVEDDFWRINILSAGKYRKQFGTLAAQMKQGRGGKGGESPRIGSNPRPDPAGRASLKRSADYRAQLVAEGKWTDEQVAEKVAAFVNEGKA